MIRSIVVLLAPLCIPVPWQEVPFATTERPQEASIAGLTARLKDDPQWWAACDELVQRAMGGEEQEVVDALTRLDAASRDERVERRTTAVVAAINRGKHARDRRARMQDSLDRLRTAADALRDFAGQRDDSELEARVAALSAKIQELETTHRDFEDGDPEFGVHVGFAFQLEDGTTRVFTPVGSRPPARDGAKRGKAKDASPVPPPEREPDRSSNDAPRGDCGDTRKIVWERPFSRARELAREKGRVLLVKPILGGSNAPDPGGVPCGGKHDCEGSW